MITRKTVGYGMLIAPFVLSFALMTYYLNWIYGILPILGTILIVVYVVIAANLISSNKRTIC